MEGHKEDKEEDLQRKMDVFDEERDGIWREMDMELESPHSSSPRATSPLTGIVDAEEIHVHARKRIPSEKGRQFEIQRLKENRKTVLSNLTKQINIISSFMAGFKNEKQVGIEVV